MRSVLATGKELSQRLRRVLATGKRLSQRLRRVLATGKDVSLSVSRSIYTSTPPEPEQVLGTFWVERRGGGSAVSRARAAGAPMGRAWGAGHSIGATAKDWPEAWASQIAFLSWQTGMGGEEEGRPRTGAPMGRGDE